ncbi:STAS domain-containing protein [Persicimonas caeni]|nr:STAS domain-containing protein [Persicimonas caeni]
MNTSSQPVTLPEQLGLAQVDELHAHLVDLLETTHEIVFDAGAVDRLDAAGVQLLCAAARATQQAGGSVSWRAVSPALVRAAEQLGLSEALLLPTEDASENTSDSPTGDTDKWPRY